MKRAYRFEAFRPNKAVANERNFPFDSLLPYPRIGQLGVGKKGRMKDAADHFTSTSRLPLSSRSLPDPASGNWCLAFFDLYLPLLFYVRRGSWQRRINEIKKHFETKKLANIPNILTTLPVTIGWGDWEHMKCSVVFSLYPRYRVSIYQCRNSRVLFFFSSCSAVIFMEVVQVKSFSFIHYSWCFMELWMS